jgi:hypothetical protein
LVPEKRGKRDDTKNPTIDGRNAATQQSPPAITATEMISLTKPTIRWWDTFVVDGMTIVACGLRSILCWSSKDASELIKSKKEFGLVATRSWEEAIQKKKSQRFSRY